MSCKPEPAIWSRDTGQRIPCFDRCQLIMTWMSNIKEVHSKPRLYVSLSTCYLEYGSHLARLHRRRRRRRCAYAPTSKTASNDNHEKINSLVSFCFPYEYGAPLVRRLGPPELRSGTYKLHVEAFVCQMILLVDRSYIHVALTWVSLQLH